MENQEPWEPTFPARSTLYPKTSYGGGVSMHLTQGPAYLSRWPTSYTSTAPTSAAAAATVASTLKSESARRISEGRVLSGGTDGGGYSPGCENGGIGGVGEGAEERLNAMAYNNAYMEGNRWAYRSVSV